MTLTKEEAERLKAKLLEKADSLPEKHRELFKAHLKNLDEKGLEEFLRTGEIKIPSTPSSPSPESQEECIFCSIAHNKVPSYKIEENNQAMAVLDINPISEGHTLVIPFKHTDLENIPKSALSLSQKIAKRIKKKLKADEVKIEGSSSGGHGIINIVPLYKDKKLERKKATQEQLIFLQDKLKIEKRKQRKKGKSKNLPEVKFRIP